MRSYWNDKKTQVLAKFDSKFNYQSHFVPQCHHSLHDGNEAVDSEAYEMNMRTFTFHVCVYAQFSTGNIHSRDQTLFG